MAKKVNKKKSLPCVLGVDGGGTKTLAVVADLSGRVLGMGRTGGSNFQGWGKIRAGIELKDAVKLALEDAKVGWDKIAFATYGIAGADRDEDFDTVCEYVEPVNGAPQYMITNDTTIALRAGTPAGVGVAQIGGTGSNTIGFSKDYTVKKVGGLGEYTGDYGSAQDIAKKGIVASMKASDGRGPKTRMTDLFCKALGLSKLEDIIELFYVDDYQPIMIGDYAHVVFQAANKGDKVALQILKKTGQEVGRDVVSCMRFLFTKEEEVYVVLAGSVLQKGENPTLVESLKTTICRSYPNVKVVKLKYAPCLGALLWSVDCLLGKPATKTLTRKLAGSLSAQMKRNYGSAK